jgi:hypothetical protein
MNLTISVLAIKLSIVIFIVISYSPYIVNIGRTKYLP